MKRVLFVILLFSIFSCKNSIEKIKPTVSSVTESIYASGIVKSQNQYQAFATVNGILKEILVKEGDTVKAGTPIFIISNDAQKLMRENAELAAQFSDVNSNRDKLQEAELLIELAKNKLKNDSSIYFRQKNLWSQKIGSQIELEQRELAWLSSKTAYQSAKIKYNDLKRQLQFSSSQSQKSLQISSKQENDFIIKSEIDGVVYDIIKSKGDLVSIQTPLAVIGDASNFVLEMQVDEDDIFKVKPGLQIMLTMDSYKGKVHEARVTRISPIMNERSKSFLVEATFVNPPSLLLPNISFEANIILNSKNNALLIPRNYILNDSVVFNANGEKVIVKTGLKDYQMIEIISGIDSNTELTKPTP